MELNSVRRNWDKSKTNFYLHIFTPQTGFATELESDHSSPHLILKEQPKIAVTAFSFYSHLSLKRWESVSMISAAQVARAGSRRTTASRWSRIRRTCSCPAYWPRNRCRRSWTAGSCRSSLHPRSEAMTWPTRPRHGRGVGAEMAKDAIGCGSREVVCNSTHWPGFFWRNSDWYESSSKNNCSSWHFTTILKVRWWLSQCLRACRSVHRL